MKKWGAMKNFSGSSSRENGVHLLLIAVRRLYEFMTHDLKKVGKLTRIRKKNTADDQDILR